MPSPRHPADPSTTGPGEREIEQFPYRHRAEREETLNEWQAFAGPWHQRARERGFANALAMIAHDEAQRGQPDETGRQAAEMHRAFAAAVAADPSSHDGEWDRTEDAPQAGASSHGEVGLPRESSGPRQSELATPPAGVGPGDIWSPPIYSESERNGVNAWQDRLVRGMIADMAQAEAEIDSVLADKPAVAARLKEAAKTLLASRERDPVGMPAVIGELREMTSRILQGKLPDPNDERRRAAFDALERRRGDRIVSSDRPGRVIWQRADGRKMEMRTDEAQTIAETGSAADANLDLLFDLKIAARDPEALRERLISGAPRATRRAHGIGYEMPDDASPQRVPDPEAVAEIDHALAELAAGDDSRKIAERILPIVMHEALLPSYKDVAASFLVEFNPVALAIGALESAAAIAEGVAEGDSEKVLLGAVGIGGPPGRLRPVARWARKGGKADATPDARSTSTTDPSTAPKTLDEAINDPASPINGKLRLKPWPMGQHLEYSAAKDFVRLSPAERGNAILAASTARGRAVEGDVTGALRALYESRNFTVMSQVRIVLPDGIWSVMDDAVMRIPELRQQPKGPHSLRASTGGQRGWIDMQEDLVTKVETKTGSARPSSGQEAVDDYLASIGRSDAFMENTVRASQINPRESYSAIADRLRKQGFSIGLDEQRFVEFHSRVSQSVSYSLFLAMIVPAFLEGGGIDTKDGI